MMTDITIIVTEDMGTMEVIEKILPPKKPTWLHTPTLTTTFPTF
jgi:hypothetical protein